MANFLQHRSFYAQQVEFVPEKQSYLQSETRHDLTLTGRVVGNPEPKPHEREVLLKGMSSEKHFSPPEWQEYFFDIQPPAPVATFVLQRLDRFVPVRSGPRGRGATGLGCSLVPVVSCSLRDGAIRFSETHKLTG